MPSSSHQSASVTARVNQVVKSVITSDPRIKSKSAFAEAIGVDKVSVSRWSMAQSNCTLENIVNICQRFRVNPVFLIFGVGDMFLNAGPDASKNRIENQLAELEIRISKLENFNLKKAGTKTRNK